MDKKFYAHTRPINENGVERTEYQLLSDHEHGVGTLCGQFAEAFGAQAEGHEAVFTTMTAKQPLHFSTVFWIMVQRSIMQPPVHKTSCCQTICS